MLWDAPRIALTQDGLKDLPEEPAVYVLWRDDAPVHAGFVTKLTQSLRERLALHVPLPGDEPTPGGPTHFSYFVTDNPVKQLGDVLPVLDAAHRDRDANN